MADSEQAAADSDEAAIGRDLAHGGDRGEHDLTRELRDRTGKQRYQIARERVDTAAARDALARARDLAAQARDQAAAVDDREMAARDATWASTGPAKTGAEIVLRAGEHRRVAVTDRVAALEGRVRAATDRDQAAHDREGAAADRLQAQKDRDGLLEQLALADTDQLTGARTRAAGLGDLDREIDRAHRTKSQLVLAFVDVVGLKAVNDAQGHGAGDALLQHAVHTMRAHLRSYDVIVRHGGDEFLCAMPDTTIQTARQRFIDVQTELAAADVAHCEIKVGCAALSENDSAAELIERADAELPHSRGR